MKKPLIVQEIKELEPKADVYSLRPQNHIYLIVVQPPKVKLIGSNPNASIEAGSALVKMLDDRGIQALLVTIDFKDEIKIIELKRTLRQD
jgi:hypothetical protein